jgi:hypothetical protein
MSGHVGTTRKGDPVRFPPIKADRALLWITLRADETLDERYAALRNVLKACRMHPMDTTAASEMVIVDAALFREQEAAVRAVLGDGDMLHLVAPLGGRLQVEVIAPPAVDADVLPNRPAERRPPWLQS